MPPAEPLDARLGPLFTVVGFLQTGDIKLDHFHHSFRYALPANPVLVFHHLDKLDRRDLPGDPKPVAQPTAGLGLAAGGQETIPIMIHFLLIFAVHHHRNGMVERLLASGTHGREGLAAQSEFDDLDRASRTTGAIGRHGVDAVDAGIGKQRNIKLCGFFGFLFLADQSM